MAAIDWAKVATDAISAAAKSLSGTWNVVQPAAEHAISTLVQTGQYISENSEKLSNTEQSSLANIQKLALQNVLLTYEDVGIAAAEQAVAAAWGVVQAAIQAAIGKLIP